MIGDRVRVWIYSHFLFPWSLFEDIYCSLSRGLFNLWLSQSWLGGWQHSYPVSWALQSDWDSGWLCVCECVCVCVCLWVCECVCVGVCVGWHCHAGWICAVSCWWFLPLFIHTNGKFSSRMKQYFISVLIKQWQCEWSNLRCPYCV